MFILSFFIIINMNKQNNEFTNNNVIENIITCYICQGPIVDANMCPKCQKLSCSKCIKVNILNIFHKHFSHYSPIYSLKANVLIVLSF